MNDCRLTNTLLTAIFITVLVITGTAYYRARGFLEQVERIESRLDTLDNLLSKLKKPDRRLPWQEDSQAVPLQEEPTDEKGI